MPLQHLLRADAAERLVSLLDRLRTGLSASGIYFGDRMFALATGFVISVLFARSYGLQEVGLYLYVVTTVQIASATLRGSCEPIMVRDLVRAHDDSEVVLGTYFWVMTVLSMFWTGAIGAIILLAHFDDARLRMLTMVFLSQYAFFGFASLDYLFKSKTQAFRSAGSRMAITAVVSVLRAGAILHHMPLSWVAAASALEGPLTAIVLSVTYGMGGGRFARWRFDRRLFREALRQTAVASVSVGMVVLFLRIGVLLVEHFDGFAEVGRLSLAMQVAGVADILPAVAATAFYPRLVALHDASLTRFSQLLSHIFRLAAGASYVVALGTAIVVAPLAVWLFGPKFSEIQFVLIALSLSTPSNWSGMVRGYFIDITGKQGLHVFNAAVGVVVLAGAGVVLVPRYGAVGAASAMAVAHFVSSVLTSFLFRTTRRVGWSQLCGLVLLARPAVPG